ncbi:PucR family transcriptional regulator [Evansella cellulosilytica]|uniref:Transcriptional regulator, CdaR n=1 Tax=Evansella cellulosilytica (strain ATCC 21833 / DSM 2522 / FERM P-1141 / JCM 9156 / N-4) TaxID=649639 RepID=E6TTE5_EVAC2|nr:PucR family transcriptional regulator ligand-binding domain-containing protein [Evansella cellulosilytica]ADU29581.1 transcriptional regulator, CdaR [Evansella cellulosilytica DSM 2522]
MKSLISLEEILKRKYFDKSEVVVGKEILYRRQVKWVHVVEVTNLTNLLKGRELILTTGLGWKQDTDIFHSFVTQLIEHKAAGLCIEMGTYMNFIPQSIIALAEKHHFPIILFHEEVPFVEITQDIHSILINKQYELISKLENYSQLLNKNLLEIDNHQEILTFLQEYLDMQVVTIFNDNQVEFYPNRSKPEREELLDKINQSNNKDDASIAKLPVLILGKRFAQLVIVTNNKDITEFELLILDRTATALAQHLLRDLYVEEKKMAQESEWLTSWLEGKYSDEVLHDHISFIDPKLVIQGGVVCVCKQMTIAHSRDIDGTYFKLLFRTVLERYGFYLFSTEIRHHVIFIIGDKRPADNWKERMMAAFNRLNKDSSGRIRMSNVSIGVGKYVHALCDMHKSYETAKETLLLQESLTKENSSYFYDDLHMYRIIALTKKHSNLTEIVNDYLEPVIAYDRKYNGDLLKTLKTYLSCNGSKQETAKKLFIVRQTLYHRIDKLENLLGNDFMSSERRVAIEFMLVAYDYLTTSKNNKLLQYNRV